VAPFVATLLDDAETWLAAMKRRCQRINSPIVIFAIASLPEVCLAGKIACSRRAAGRSSGKPCGWRRQQARLTDSC
jgi:hypothetical protein